jgi:hypothetical protein
MDDLGDSARHYTAHVVTATPQVAGAIPAPVALRLLAEFQDIGNLLRAYAALAQGEGRHECAWRLDKQAQEVARAAALIRPSLAR